MTNYWKKITLIVTISLIAMALIWFFITKSAIESYYQNKSAYDKKQDDLLTIYDKIEILQKNSKSSTNSANVISQVALLWPDNVDVSKFIVQTEELAKQKNFVIENFTISEKKITSNKSTSSSSDSDSSDSDAKAKAAKSTTITQYSFNVNTTYENALDIIKSMERLARFNAITTFNISGQESNNTVNLNITGKLYYGK